MKRTIKGTTWRRAAIGGTVGLAMLGIAGGMAPAHAATTTSVPTVLAKIRYCESGNNYQAQNASSSASGAYQFLTSTWQSLSASAGYATAASAPASVQDAAAIELYNAQGTSPWAASQSCWSALGAVPTTSSSSTSTGSTSTGGSSTGSTSTGSSTGATASGSTGSRSTSSAGRDADGAGSRAGWHFGPKAGSQTGSRTVAFTKTANSAAGTGERTDRAAAGNHDCPQGGTAGAVAGNAATGNTGNPAGTRTVSHQSGSFAATR